MFYEFSCGCKFPIVDHEIKEYDGLPSMEIPYDKILYELNYGKTCPAVWELLGTGNTKGIFQLEKNLGKDWSKKLQPESIEEFSALISLIRPGVLRAIVDDKSMAQHYVDRKHHIEPVEYIHPSLENSLRETMGVLLYQEQAMSIAKDIAGFNLQEADSLRKVIGKKLPEGMAKIKSTFLDGCKKQAIVNEQQSEDIFGWIKESQRYSFNKCLSPDTLVELENKDNVTLRDVKIGDRIKCSSGYTTVVNKYWNGQKKVYRVTTANECSIVCTKDHKFETVAGVITINEIFCQASRGILKFEVITELGPSPVLFIEDYGLSETMDIEVDNPNHVFYGTADANFGGISVSNSHGVGYSTIGYLCAYVKQHFPLHFFCSWIGMAHEKQDPKEELMELVYDARTFGIDIIQPSVLDIEDGWSSISNGKVRLGVLNISKVGLSQLKKLKEQITNAEELLGKPLIKFTWLEFLLFIADIVSEPTIVGLISVGAVQYPKITRSKLLHEFKSIRMLSDREKDWLRRNIYKFDSIDEGIELGLGSVGKERAFFNKNRLKEGAAIAKSLQNPPSSLDDDIRWLTNIEQELLGVSITCSKIDKCDTFLADTTCKQFSDGKPGNNFLLGVEILSSREYKIQKGEQEGKTMAFLKVADESGTLDGIIVFPNMFDLYQDELYSGNTVLISGYRSKKQTFIVDRINII